MRHLAPLAAFLLVPLLVGAAAVVPRFAFPSIARPAVEGASPPIEFTRDPSKPIAVLVAGNGGTEITDLLPPYEELARTGAFDLYVVAPERRPSPLVNNLLEESGVDLLPDLSLAEYDERIGRPPALLVVPFLPQYTGEDAALLPWLRRNAGPNTQLLTICAGSGVLAASGVIDGRTVTSHHGWLERFQRRNPAVHFIGGARWVEDGNLISSAGLTAGTDATLMTIERMLGPQAAARAVETAGYRHGNFLEQPAFTPPPLNLAALPRAAWGGRSVVGLLLPEGFSEADLAALADTWASTLDAKTLGVSLGDGPIRSRHGLRVVPAKALAAATSELARILVPRSTDADAEREAARLAPDASSTILRGNGFAYDLALSALAEAAGPALATAAADNLVYPADGTRGFDSALLWRPLCLGLLGAGAILAIRAVRAVRRGPSARC